MDQNKNARNELCNFGRQHSLSVYKQILNRMMRYGITSFFLLIALTQSAQNNPESAFAKSYQQEYETQYQKAIAALLESGSDSYEINLRLGWLYYLSKDYIKSQIHYKKAISLEPSSIEARFGLVLPSSAMGNWNDVLNVYLEILKNDPQNSIASYRAALIFYSRKEYQSAIPHILKVIRMYPFDFDSNLLYCKILISLDRPVDAKKYLHKALEYNPQSEEALALMKKL